MCLVRKVMKPTFHFQWYYPHCPILWSQCFDKFPQIHPLFFEIGLHLLFEIKCKAGKSNIFFCIQQSASIWFTSFTQLLNNGCCGEVPRACFNGLSQNKLKNMLFAPLHNTHYSPVVWSWCTRYWQIAGCKKIFLDVHNKVDISA